MLERRESDLRGAMAEVRRRIDAIRDQIKTAEADEVSAALIAGLVTSGELRKHFSLKAKESGDKLRYQTGLKEELRLNEQALRELQKEHASICDEIDRSRTLSDVGPNESLILMPRVGQR